MADLLEALRENSGCSYISDLHISCFAPKVKRGVFALGQRVFRGRLEPHGMLYFRNQPLFQLCTGN